MIDDIRKKIKELENLKDKELKEKSEKLIKYHTDKNSTYTDIDKDIILGFSLAIEAIKRVLGMSAYDVQIKGAIKLNLGNVVEIKTGEGKTLTAVIPAYLNALNQNKSVHIITVNEYLVKRDYEEMKPVYEFLGLSCGYITSGMTKNEKKENYNKNIVYITNSELGFDYLRDNMVKNKDDMVQSSLDFCIIDEADSILIDEAKTPLVISSPANRIKSVIYKTSFMFPLLKKGEIVQKYNKSSLKEYSYTGDYIVDYKENLVFLTDQGIKIIEDYFNIDNLGSRENTYIRNAVDNMLVANCLLEINKDYVIRDGEVLLVDDFTGRILQGRRYSHGLHEAIEAKEKIQISDFSDTLLSITYPGLFKLYKKKAAMTGTAFSSKNEFKELYKMNALKIPTNKPIKRVDLDDAIFNTKEEKLDAICREIKETYDNKQPVLIGTISILSSEEISTRLKKLGIPHNVLNAKNDKEEADIISKAGFAGSVTVATNMAGRGTDIKPDKKALERGGLYVIGSERHESKRIDDQLRGRSGRQGDVGKSKFFVSLEDDLIAKTNFDIPKINPFNRNIITIAQKQVEQIDYGYRKNNQYYAVIDNKIRESIFKLRKDILFSNSMEDLIKIVKENKFNVIANDDIVFDDYKYILIEFLDELIKDVIQYEEYLKQFIGFYGYAQKKPHFIYAQKLNEYIKQKYNFELFLEKIYEEENND